MSNKAIKIPIYAPTVVLSVFAEREGNSVTAPFFSALYSDGDIEFDIWQALVYNAEAATVTSREMKAAEAALLYNHAQLGFVSTFYRHTKQYTRAKESDLDVAMIYTGPPVKTTSEKIIVNIWCTELNQLHPHAAPVVEKHAL